MPPKHRLPPGQYAGFFPAHPGATGRLQFRQCLKSLTMRHRTVRFRSSSQRSPDVLFGRLFLGRSPPRLLNAAAPGGLKPTPESRLREACSHLQHSSASFHSHS
jgi:hypothetical protein